MLWWVSTICFTLAWIIPRVWMAVRRRRWRVKVSSAFQPIHVEPAECVICGDAIDGPFDFEGTLIPQGCQPCFRAQVDMVRSVRRLPY